MKLSAEKFNMDINRHFPVIAVIPVLLVLAGAISAYFVKFNPLFTKKEEAILKFSFEKPALIDKPVYLQDVTGLVSPLHQKASVKTEHPSKQDFPPVPLAQVAPKSSKPSVEITNIVKIPEVTFVLIAEKGNSAIIDGHFVREGDHVGNNVVVSIKRSKVLLKDSKGEQWVPVQQ